MSTYEVSYYKDGWGGSRKMTVEAEYTSEAEELVENMVGSGCTILTTFEKKQPQQTSSGTTSFSGGGLLLVGGAFALYFAALYAPFLCAGGSAILAFKFTKPKHESKLLKTKLRWRLLAVIVAAGIGAFGGDQIQRQLEVGPYQNTISQLTQK